MPQPDRRILISYGLRFALVAIAALAALIRLALTPWVGHDMPFVVFIFPLNGIALGAEILERQSGGNSKHVDLARMILRQTGLMQKLIDDMLDIARIEQG